MISDGLQLLLCSMPPHSLSLIPCSLLLLVSRWASSPFFMISFFILFLLLCCHLSTRVFLSQLISLFPWMNCGFNQTTSDKMSPQVPLEFTQVHNFLQLSVLIWALWGPRDLLLELGFCLCKVSLHGVLILCLLSCLWYNNYPYIFLYIRE